MSEADSGIGPAKRHGVLPHAVFELATAGLSVTEALATATSGAASACGVSAGKGRLAPGYDADLLVVDGHLEIDVTALLRPRAVLPHGLPVVDGGLELDPGARTVGISHDAGEAHETERMRDLLSIPPLRLDLVDDFP